MLCRGATRDQKLTKKYGLSREGYRALFAQQEGRCAICGDRPEVLNVDHCHSTGRVRGLLCTPCNLGIGYFRDSPSALGRAVDYLS